MKYVNIFVSVPYNMDYLPTSFISATCFCVHYVYKAWDYDPCAYDANILKDQVHPTGNSMQRERTKYMFTGK